MTVPRKYTYRRMTAKELSMALDAITALNDERFSKGRFTRLTGWNHQKVDRMLSGETDIPHETTVLLSILADPVIGRRAMEIGRTVTDALVLTQEGEEDDLGDRLVRSAKEARDIVRGKGKE